MVLYADSKINATQEARKRYELYYNEEFVAKEIKKQFLLNLGEVLVLRYCVRDYKCSAKTLIKLT
ncbi:hypothetical protein [Helicobacter sp. WB40]|uniref:hypothetical protein n=1 Tax=Helicobacter sp. WB40 TaxID=3004130 RepID=UPI0022EBD89A|nr:hypothetical protein [Helicobacter sp. WB40]MDA3967280.1 hypothetical protein [Helicobacter sp. WB40]